MRLAKPSRHNGSTGAVRSRAGTAGHALLLISDIRGSACVFYFPGGAGKRRRQSGVWARDQWKQMGRSRCCGPPGVQRSLSPFLTVGIGLWFAVGRRQQLWQRAYLPAFPDITSSYVISQKKRKKGGIILLNTLLVQHHFLHQPVTNYWSINV